MSSWLARLDDAINALERIATALEDLVRTQRTRTDSDVSAVTPGPEGR